MASISNDTDPEGKTKNLTVLQLKLPHCKGIDDVTVKVDDGAEGNILPLNSFRAMFPHALAANGYPKPGFLRGSKMTLECYDDGKLINHGSIKLRLQHYLEKSFQDHSFYVVETKTPKPIIIGHPTSIRLGLIWVLCKNISKSVLAIKKTPENSTKNSFQDHQLRIDSKTPWRCQRTKSESSVHSFQDHLGNHHEDKQDGHKCPSKDSFKTIHQKSGKSVLSRPSTKCAKNGPKSGSSKAIKPQNLHKKGSFKTIEDGSKNDIPFKTIGENGQKSTPFKTIVNRVKNLNPQYMVPVDEVSQVISDPKSRKKAQPVTEQLSSSPSPPGSWFNPHLCGARISVHRQYQGSSSIVSQQLWLHQRHAGWVWHQDRPNSPTSPAQKTESSHQVQRGDQEGVSRDGLTENHHQADWAHTMGQQPDVPQKGKQQVEDMPWPQGLEQGNHLWEPQSTNPQGDSSCPHGSHQDLQGRWQQGLLWDAPYRGSLTPHNIQHPPQKVQIPTCPIWTQNVTGYVPNEDGWHCGPMPWCIGHPWWCVHLWKEWQRPWCKHHKLVQYGQKNKDSSSTARNVP